MKFLIVLCLGTLALSAPAPQKGRTFDFLYDNDEEIPALVQPLEISTVEPKTTATKITGPREPAPVFEEKEEEEADIQEDAREAIPTASPLNTKEDESEVTDHREHSEQTNDAESDSQENEKQTEFTESDSHENENQTESSVSTDSPVADTTIRVYDDKEINGPTEEDRVEQLEQEQEQDQEQDQEHAQEQDQEQEQEQFQEQDQEQDQEHFQEQDQEHKEEHEHAGKNRVQEGEIDDSYQYDDESLERQLQNDGGQQRETTTAAPESNFDITVTNRDLNEELNHATQEVQKNTFEGHNFNVPVMIPSETTKWESGANAGLANWHTTVHQDTDTNRDLNVELKSGQVFNHGSLILEKGTFEGQDMQLPLSGSFPMNSWKHGPKPEFFNWSPGPLGHHDHPNFQGPPHEHQFDGAPPPWTHQPHFHHNYHHNHDFDHKSYQHTGYIFHDNQFLRGQGSPQWKHQHSVPSGSGWSANRSE